MPKRVFISYRREDTAADAGRICDRLRMVLPKDDVFMDVETIEGGEDFEKSILAAIDKSDAALVFIGKRWMMSRPGGDQPRICEAGDYVRLEVRSALAKGILVLPVLVDGALMPAPNLLPEDVRPLTARNALSLRHDGFDDDAENILAVILGTAAKVRLWDKRTGLAAKCLYAAAGAIAGFVALVVAAGLHKSVMGRSLSESIGDGFTVLLLAGCVVFGAGFGLYAAGRRGQA
jgi:TIR domain